MEEILNKRTGAITRYVTQAGLIHGLSLAINSPDAGGLASFTSTVLARLRTAIPGLRHM
jgi:hypothetical protein